jgi:pyridoxal/pyridoxine/pyridoxamine kinase
MGYDVDAINSIMLSNHPAYANGCKGESLSNDIFKEIVNGNHYLDSIHFFKPNLS